ncbi:ubiquitin carboxyl-terminal hydrolase [Niveomyces insectorum RCEF 264]|uniref:Ubiquitin carboxyl-terminal hydrolase n=1 Tax=Niveomyces insectorum RCEF 264 TaxID=1081102 RepID=A0A167PRZ6_9HYPO|nr:ubiquitin carboxyl-terminal hydrolase [Niveomyces insectorum RCEF 264]
MPPRRRNASNGSIGAAAPEKRARHGPSRSSSSPAAAAPPNAAKSAALTAQMAAGDDAAGDAVPPQDTIHDELFAPVSQEELEAWQGWTDIESEPAFFNAILKELGVQDAKIHEIFTVDDESMAHLPNPVGLIFLYKFVEEDENEVREACPDHLWFANQTTSNACGTIAMLNIAMNCDGIRLGDHLARFKAATQHLHPALRGHLLSTNTAIRSAHNSFARRLDMLMSDVALKWEWTEAAKAKKTTTTAKRKARQGGGRRKRRAGVADADAAFHFIAYVPIGQDVWELNGMQEKPLKIGSFDTGDWTAMARDRIDGRMQAYAPYDDMPFFSLLALCHTPKEGEQDTNGGGLPDRDSFPEGRGDDDDGNDGNDDDDDDDGSRAAARRRDYTPAVHAWIKKLADKGVLRRLATGKEDEEV